MTRNELINDVISCYFNGGNWQAYLKELVKEANRHGDINSSTNPMRSDVSHSAADLKPRV